MQRCASLVARVRCARPLVPAGLIRSYALPRSPASGRSFNAAASAARMQAPTLLPVGVAAAGHAARHWSTALALPFAAAFVLGVIGGCEAAADQRADSERIRHLSAEETAAIMTDMYNQLIVLQTNINAQYAAGIIPDESEDLKSAFLSAMSSLEVEMQAKYNFSKDDFSTALEEYRANEDVKNAVWGIQALFTSGDPTPQNKPGYDMGLEEFFSKLQAYNRTYISTIEAIIFEVNRMFKRGPVTPEQFDAMVSDRLTGFNRRVQADGVALSQYAGAVERYAKEPRVMAEIAKVKREYEEAMQKLSAITKDIK